MRRVSLDSPTANSEVEAARREGVPLVLTDLPDGWVKWSKGWLRNVISSDSSTSSNAGVASCGKDGCSPVLNTEAMISDIGDELVPVIRRDYNAADPIHGHILASTFIKKSWEAGDNHLYMHQWQFPLSPTAAGKLCKEDLTLPCMGINLLKFIDADAINPFQYIFMGAEGTHSKIHQDNGGLAIIITPIVGEKVREEGGRGRMNEERGLCMFPSQSRLPPS